MTQTVRKAVIPAAGLGTRFLPASKVTPKEMLPVVDRPILQWILEELRGAGVEEFILVISKGKESLLDHFRPHPDLEKLLEAKGNGDLLELIKQTRSLGNVTAVYQDQPRGLGHAVYCAREAVGDEPFFVALGDDLIDAEPSCARQMVQGFQKYGRPMVAVQEVAAPDVKKYGIIKSKYPRENQNYSLDADKRFITLEDLVEKPDPAQAPSRLAIVGRYLLTPEIFPILAKTEKGAGGEIQLTDGLRALNREKELLAYQFQGRRFDAGDKLGFQLANLHYALKNPQIGPALRDFIKKI